MINNNKPKFVFSIIIPVYNEENFIKQALEKVLAESILEVEKEVVVINDGSTDKTQEIVEKIASKHKCIRSIKLDKNQGKCAAVKVGISHSAGEIVIIQDADLEYDPSDYPLMIEPFLTKNADVVYGSRFISNRPHRVLYFWHSLGNRFLTLLSNTLTNLNLTDMETGYKAFRGDLIRSVAPKLKSKRFGFEPEITARLSKIKNVNFYEVGISYWGRSYDEGKKITWVDGLKAVYEILYFNLFSG